SGNGIPAKWQISWGGGVRGPAKSEISRVSKKICPLRRDELMKFQTAASRRWIAIRAIPVAGLLLLAACGASNTPTGGGLGSGDLLVGVIAPFTGTDAGLGPAYYAAC